MSLPVFPALRPLILEDKPAFDNALSLDPPEISEYTFSNLYAWRDWYRFEVCRLDEQVLLASSRGKSREFFEPLGPGGRKPVMKKVFGQSRGRFIRIPEKTKSLFESDSRFRVELDPDNSDYVYAAEDLINLPGNRYSAKRNLIKNFEKAYAHEYFEVLEENLEELKAFEDLWCLEKGCDQVVSLEAERKAVRELLDHFTFFGLTAGAIRINGTICAAAIGERLNEDTLVMHFSKAKAEFKGLYQAILHDFLSREARDYRYVNLEQDLGVAGIRKAKLSYHPARMVNKYTIFQA